MLAEKGAQTQESGSTSSSVNDKEIVTKVLGERRGHNRGIGRKLKGSAYASFFEPPTPPPPQPPSTDGIKAVMDVLNASTQYMYQAHTAPPGSQLPPPPVIDTQAILALLMSGQHVPQQAPQQAPQEDEDEDEEDTESD